MPAVILFADLFRVNCSGVVCWVRGPWPSQHSCCCRGNADPAGRQESPSSSCPLLGWAHSGSAAQVSAWKYMDLVDRQTVLKSNLAFNGALCSTLVFLVMKSMSVVVAFPALPVKANVAQHLWWPGEIRVRNTNLTYCVVRVVGQKSALAAACTLSCLQDKR